MKSTDTPTTTMVSTHIVLSGMGRYTCPSQCTRMPKNTTHGTKSTMGGTSENGESKNEKHNQPNTA
jgi:hypothetical protein